MLTQLGLLVARLSSPRRALRYAPSPQANGKIEHRHDYWQKRLPPLLGANDIRELESHNLRLDRLLPHVSQHEIHRDLGIPPRRRPHENKPWPKTPSVLRCVPACPWWPYVLSQQTRVRGNDDSKVPVSLAHSEL